MRNPRRNLHRFHRGRAQHSDFPVGLIEPSAGVSRSFLVRAKQIARQQQDRTVAERSFVDGETLRAEPRPLPFCRGVQLIAGDIIDNTQDRLSRVEQADADAENPQSGEEIVGSVDRVDHPVSPAGLRNIEGDGVASLVFFADDSIAGEFFPEPGDDKPLAGAIGFGDGFVIALGQPLHLPVLLRDERPGGARQLGREAKLVSEVHGGRG